MVTIPHVIKKIMVNKPFIQECMIRGLINLGALAEYLKPEIEIELEKPVKQLAISMALRRYLEKFKESPLINLKIDPKSELIAISNQIEIIIKKSDKALFQINNFSNSLNIESGDRISIIQGSRELSVVVNSKYYKEFKNLFQEEEIISVKKDLGIILMYIPKRYISTPGFFYLLSKQLSFNNINILGLSNIKSEVFFMFDNKDLPRAYQVLCKMIPQST